MHVCTVINYSYLEDTDIPELHPNWPINNLITTKFVSTDV